MTDKEIRRTEAAKIRDTRSKNNVREIGVFLKAQISKTKMQDVDPEKTIRLDKTIKKVKSEHHIAAITIVLLKINSSSPNYMLKVSCRQLGSPRTSSRKE